MPPNDFSAHPISPLDAPLFPPQICRMRQARASDAPSLPRGRPAIVGRRVHVLLPSDLLGEVDAARGDADRSTFLRCCIQVGMGAGVEMLRHHAEAARVLQEIAERANHPVWHAVLANTEGAHD